MTEDREAPWNDGYKAAWADILQQAIARLGIEDPEAGHAKWILERQAVVRLLRRLCAKCGDNDWPDNLHLVDVITKHLHLSS